MDSPATYAALAALLTVLYLFTRKSDKPSPPLPPGPKPVWILGNVRDLTAKELWLQATKWSKEFGEVTYLHVFGQGLVFLSGDAIFDLLDKRGSIYSDKPQLVMAGELCGCNDMVAFTPYGDQMRRQRKLIHRAFTAKHVPNYYPLFERETGPFLQRLLVNPSQYPALIRRYAGSLTLLVVYGHEVKSSDDTFLLLAEECVSILSNRIASGGGIWPVDIFPSLQHIPDWFPGASFKRNATIWKAKMEEFVEKPYQSLKKNIKEGTAVPSFCSALLEEAAATKSLTEEKEFDIKWTANSMYSASMDTTIAAVSHFMLAMMEHPDVLKKAQSEIDAVVGNARLPNFEDRPSLPYVEAVMSECLRWGAPVPLNLPHRLMEDDIYNGMYIPKGSLVFGNIWAMLRDEKLYPNAEQFYPERFLEKVDFETERQRDPRNYVFGFGRRRCPGADVVDSFAWLLMACMIACLSISKPVDGQGQVIEPQVSFDNAVFRTPSHFKCDIRPRSEQALRVLHQSSDTL